MITGAFGFLLLLPLTQLGPNAESLDAKLLAEALRELHPGLNRYQSSSEFDTRCEVFVKSAQTVTERKDFVLLVAEFLASIRCGHTHMNPFNQTSEFMTKAFEVSNKLPFCFEWIDGEMIVRKNLSKESELRPGTRIAAINGVPTTSILKSLEPLVRADGGRSNKRRDLLCIRGRRFEDFDLLHSLVFPFEGSAISVLLENGKLLKLSGITSEERTERLMLDDLFFPRNYDDLWDFRVLNSNAAVLKLGTFVTWRMKRDWKKFLKECFDELRSRRIPNLLIDIRGNEGGDDSVAAILASFLVDKAIELRPFRSEVVFQRVTDRLRPYLETWNQAVFDLTDRTYPIGSSRFVIGSQNPEPKKIGPFARPYEGRVFLTVGPENSSSTFYLAWRMKDAWLATLIGSETGGSRRGLNGSQMVVLKLPNTGITVDIPLIASVPLSPQPDEGIKPDILVNASARNIAANHDPVLAKFLQLSHP